MASRSRVSRFIPQLLIIAFVASGAGLHAQTDGPPVIDVPPAVEEVPVVEVEPPAPKAEASAEPVAKEVGESVERPAATVITRPIAVPSSVAQPPLPSTAPPPYVTSDVVPVTGGPAAVVPSASGTPIVVQPPVIEPPKVIDEPWTLPRALPWLFAGLLIGGSLALLLFRERKRRRLVRYEVEKLRTMPAEPPAAQPLVAPSEPDRVRPREGVQVLVRKVGEPDATAAPPTR